MNYVLFGFLLFAPACQATHVHGYTRKNGTHVHSYERHSRASHPRAYVPHPRAPHATTHSYRPPAGPPARTHSYRPPAKCASCARNAEGRIKRSPEARDAFKRQSPCPANGRSSGPCPGYVIDHKKPLACGGADAPSNMQWQTLAESKAKDRVERAGCVN